MSNNTALIAPILPINPQGDIPDKIEIIIKPENIIIRILKI